MDDNYSKEFNSSGDNFGDEHLKKRNSSGSNSSEVIRKAVEQCLLSSSSTLDISRKNIKHLTEEIHRLPCIKYFHLEGNVISTIPEDLFQKLPHLVWLDLRNNKIKALPPGIGYHRQLKTLLLERNPIKELPTELGNLTSLTALNLRHCPLEFPPKDVIQKGLKSILCFLRDSGNGKPFCMEPATSEMPPVEKLNLSELWQSSLDLSEEWPNEEEKLRFQKLKEEIIKHEREEFLADERVGAVHDFTEAGRNHRKKEQLYLESASLCRSFREKLEQRVKQHMQMMKAREEKLKGTSQGEMKKAKQDIETVEDLQTKLAKTKGGLPLQEYRLTAFAGELPPESPRMQTQKAASFSWTRGTWREPFSGCLYFVTGDVPPAAGGQDQGVVVAPRPRKGLAAGAGSEPQEERQRPGAAGLPGRSGGCRLAEGRVPGLCPGQRRGWLCVGLRRCGCTPAVLAPRTLQGAMQRYPGGLSGNSLGPTARLRSGCGAQPPPWEAFLPRRQCRERSANTPCRRLRLRQLGLRATRDELSPFQTRRAPGSSAAGLAQHRACTDTARPASLARFIHAPDKRTLGNDVQACCRVIAVNKQQKIYPETKVEFN
ncbi:leucine-rich repeat-containing protein 27 [Calonectris borealis]|uniref:leucine-rich repeat-containing protein 27 n=1 Tax=Calonectris borealis TaxID=1323832 RepID=UPI003F4B9166